MSSLVSDAPEQPPLRFPIPMRGNEDTVPRADYALMSRRAAFPIPMRGNERASKPLWRPTARFPIPMRGNEPDSMQLEIVAGVQVSDPHEG